MLWACSLWQGKDNPASDASSYHKISNNHRQTHTGAHVHTHTESKRQRKQAKYSRKSLQRLNSHLLLGLLAHQYCRSPFNFPAHWACLSISFMSIKVSLSPHLRPHNVNGEQKECIQVRFSEVWGYSAEISHWRKVNMAGVMRLEPDWERRRGHMGLIMAQLSDSKAVFIDLARARILQTLET